MRKFLASCALLSLLFTPSWALARTDRDDEHGRQEKHGKGKEKRRRDWDDDDRGDRGLHKGWYKHGRYKDVKRVWKIRTFEVRSRRVILVDRSTWVIASYDIPRCRDWAWDRDEVYVYDDDRHPGWYLLFNARLGRTVHVEFLGLAQ
jgi:hypothetical protein